MPGPVRTLDLAAAAADEPEPLAPDEWRAVDRAHDAYLAAFDQVRSESIAPLVRDARAREQKELERDATFMQQLARRHRSALARIRALDEALAADLLQAMPTRTAFVERMASRRAVARAACVVEGLGDGGRRSGTILDLDPVVRGMELDPAHRAAVEPALATYRRTLARAAEQLADAQVEHPIEVHAALAAEGLDQAQLDELEAASAQGPDQRKAWDDARTRADAARRKAGSGRARAMAAVDDVNRSGLESICAALPAEAAARLRELDVERRVSSAFQPEGRFTVMVIEAAPEVRSGAAPRTAAAVRAARATLATLDAAMVADIRARLDARARGEPSAERPEVNVASDEFRTAMQGLMNAWGTESAGHADREDLLQWAAAPGRGTADEVRDALAKHLGPAAAARIVTSMPNTVFAEEKVVPDFGFNSDLSFAEQLLLAPGMDHAAFRRAARALGAKDDDAMVEQVWERHEARRAELETRQRNDLRALEQRAVELTRNQGADTDPAPFERTIAEYLQALLNADSERLAADDETFREIAIVIGMAESDVRFAMARAVSAARRASLPWRRFRQPWLLGPLWQADADPVSMALEEEDELVRQAALGVLLPHLEPLRAGADAARRAGLESLRDLLLFGLRKQREGVRLGSPETYRDAPEVRAMVRRIDESAAARRRAQREAIAAVHGVDAALGAEYMRRWSRATFPDFFMDGHAWRDAQDVALAAPAAAGADAAGARVAAAADRWRIVDQDMAERLCDWQDSRGTTLVPDGLEDLTVACALDPTLGMLRSLRDENAWRLLREAAIAGGEAPDRRMRDGPAGGSLPRPVASAP
ncbi:MAG: hypothetical protein ACKOTD_03400 [Phycisphaerales bacterium]